MNTYERDWKELWIDQMGLIVCLSGEDRFQRMREFKAFMALLSQEKQAELKEAIRMRFTPSNGQDGCQTAMRSVKEVME